ncbi:hypothetical protein C8R44DRAFT_226538 [Mycena epipterygia]|nr:hypothetical protein C8R44DRAFT_226538 [Mycena epipterygia]
MESSDAIDASALQACGDLTQQASSYWAEYTSRVRRHQSCAPFPLVTARPTGTSPQSPTSPTTSAAATGTRQASSHTSSRVRHSRHSPSSRVSSSPRLTATAQSRSQSTARRAASSSASHATCTSTTSNSILCVQPPQRDSLPRLLGKDEDKDARVLDRQRTLEAERGTPSVVELLTIYQSGQQTTALPTSYDFAVSPFQPFAYATARSRMRSTRHFSASTPPSSTSGSSNGHVGDLTLARLLHLPKSDAKPSSPQLQIDVEQSRH